MTVFSYSFQRLPRGVRVEDLANNFKLYSDEEIVWIKRHFTENGRHRYYLDTDGVQHKLKYPVYVLDGQYFVVYPGKKYLLADGDSAFSRDKLAQNLDTGEWLVDKTILVDPSVNDVVQADVINEQNLLIANQQMILSDAHAPASFHRPVNGDIDNEDGKYDLFMPYASGMDLQDWLESHPDLPLIVKMNMSLGLLHELARVHERGTIHRDIKLRNAIFDVSKNVEDAVRLVDYGLALSVDDIHDELLAGWGTPGYMAPEILYSDDHECGDYSEKSDIYALGVTIGIIWGLIQVKDGVMSFTDDARFKGDIALKIKLSKLLRSMTSDDPSERPLLRDLKLDFSLTRALMPKEYCVVKTGYIDLYELQQAYESGENTWNHAIVRLGCYDQIQLFDTLNEGNPDARLFLSIKQELVNRGLVVNDDLYRGALTDIKAHAEACCNQVDQKSHVISHMSVLSLAAQQPQVKMVDTAVYTDSSVESYSWMDCLSWFFGNLAQDAARATQQLAGAECAPGCFGFFSRPENVGGLRNHQVELSGDDLVREGQIRSRY